MNFPETHSSPSPNELGFHLLNLTQTAIGVFESSSSSGLHLKVENSWYSSASNVSGVHLQLRQKMHMGSSSTGKVENCICFCGVSCAKRVSWIRKNPGRRFIACKNYDPNSKQRGCKKFIWINENVVDWQREVTFEITFDLGLLSFLCGPFVLQTPLSKILCTSTLINSFSPKLVPPCTT